jgi:predicted kinase
MQKVTILSGVSGSGKSTLATQFWRDGLGAVVVSADNGMVVYEPEAREYVYRFDAALLPQAHAYCLRSFDDFLRTGVRHLVVDNTNTTALEIAPYYALARAYGVEVGLTIIEAKPEHLEQCAQRNIHGVSVATIEMQHARLRRLVPSLPSYWELPISFVPMAF